ncbi:hypothetical protein A1Q2_06634 [Trichosporon asahii var. asahii CBS 8904]|uniref:Uncharacterized protein n=1 Tax=Trichosporon asahii var. asahii (strain CBS 8904) TaxID=1220162 RepID=K1WBN6_TRIAC|nr:hypothetical protein A1Q2_06634 [Trichosporon asahii var. asahii CBS 8904]
MRTRSLDDLPFCLGGRHPNTSGPHHFPGNSLPSASVALTSPPHGTGPAMISSSIVQASIVASADLDTLHQLAVTHKGFAAAVRIHLIRKVGHLLLRPTEREDIRQDIVVLSTTGSYTLTTAGWWTDPHPGKHFTGIRTVTLPVRRAVAALRWVCGCPEEAAEPAEVEEDDNVHESQPVSEAGSDTDGDEPEDAKSTPWDFTPSPSLAPTPQEEDSAHRAHPTEAKGQYVEPSDPSAPLPLEEEAADGEEPDDVEDDTEQIEVDPRQEVWELTTAANYVFPTDVECTLETVVLDCLKVDASGGGATEIAGILPSSVKTVILRTRPRLERRDEREELLAELREAPFPLPASTSSAVDIDSPTTDGKQHWALEHEKHMAFHVPAIAGDFTTLILSLEGMHPDALLDTSLVTAPLERIVVVCGLEGCPKGLDPSWRSFTGWAKRPAQKWGVFQALMERFAGQDVRIDVVDAGRVDGDTEDEESSAATTPEPEPDQSTTAPAVGGLQDQLDQQHDAQAQNTSIGTETPPQIGNGDNATPPPAPIPRRTLIGCAYEDLPRREVRDVNYFSLIEEDEDDSRHMKIVADIRYLDSRRDVGRGKPISSAEWKLWTELYATD